MTQRRSLRIRSRDAASWSVVQIVVSSAMRLGSNLILTRLLAPEAFGLIGLAMTVVTALTLLSDIDDTKAEARYENGMLELRLPKKAGAKSKALPVL